ncbi:MAG: hypothetical protein R2707_05445 [Acidimicrobiales bacterium]
MIRRWIIRFPASLLGMIGILLAVATPASADAPGPTDYESRVVSISPTTDVISVAFIGGDSFIELVVEEGHEVLVLGYNGEPYLRFDPDGTVWENTASPTRYLNEDRFAAVEIPAAADADAEPQWSAVGSAGRYAWHDHRTHWMNEARPPAASPGDQILEAVVPLVIDGQDVDIAVASYWLPAPGAWSTTLVFGTALVALVGVFVARGVWRWGIAAGVGVGALGLGLVAYQSVPAETGPPRSLWLLPLIALIALAAAAASRARSTVGAALVRAALVFLAGSELLFWGLSRRDAIRSAIIPSNAPELLDRLGIAVAAAVGLGVAVVSLIDLFAIGRPQPSPDS